jgi:hypothetical protein
MNQFSAQVPFKGFDRYVYSTAALFLAAKDDDEFRTLHDIVGCHILLHENNERREKDPHGATQELPKDLKPMIEVRI